MNNNQSFFLQNYDLSTFQLSNYDEFLKSDDYPDYKDKGYAFAFGDAPCLPEVKKDFEEMIEASEKVPADFKMKGFARFIAGILKMFRVLF